MTDTDRDDLLFAADFISWKRGDHTEMGEDEANRIEALLRRLARIPAAPDEGIGPGYYGVNCGEKSNTRIPEHELAALSAIPIPAPTGEDAPTRDDWNWLFKSVERGLFDKTTSAKGALLILANYPGAPWKMGRWDVDHKPYAVEFYKHFPRAALTDHTTKGAE